MTDAERYAAARRAIELIEHSQDILLKARGQGENAERNARDESDAVIRSAIAGLKAMEDSR